MRINTLYLHLKSNELSLLWFYLSSRFAPFLSTLLILAFIIFIFPSTALAKNTQLPLLTEPGLDADSSPLLPYVQPILSRWMEENADLVTGTQDNGIAPSGGTGMVSLFETGGVVSQVRQRIDISHLAGKIDQGLITAYALGRVNTSNGDVVGGTLITAQSDASGAGASGNLANGSGGIRTLDGDTSTWETTYSYLILPAGTRSVEFQFLFTNDSLAGGKIGYGDEAVLVLSESRMSCSENNINLDDIYGTWDEDPNQRAPMTEHYVPTFVHVVPARFWNHITFNTDGTGEIFRLGRADNHHFVPTSWTLCGDLLTVNFTETQNRTINTFTYRVLQADGNNLRLEVISKTHVPIPYSIGDIGPGIGIVFHVTDGGLHGLEAARIDLSTADWGCQGTPIDGTNTSVGTGASNTSSILAGCNASGIAAELADTYISPGYLGGFKDDWFLPSKDELKLLFQQKDVVGGFTDDFYWSSSEITPFISWAQKFNNFGHQSIKLKNSTLRVRAIRAF
ncbi:MAG: hypothetical protein KAG45_08300 [Methyloprofundus sp.]|nr:hypothetical protein [Methyloprofundus sp.]